MGQIVIARQLGQSMCKTAALVTIRRWSKLTDICGVCRLVLLVPSNRCPTLPETANPGSDRNVSDFTVHHIYLNMGLHSRRSVRVPS